MFAASKQPDETQAGTAAWWRNRYPQRLRHRDRGLTLEGICTAALAILDRDGLRELTMRRLADELGTGPASLYRYIASREELLVELADRLIGELSAPDESLGWRDAVEQLAHELRRVLLAHGGVVLLITNGPLLGPNSMRLREMFWRVMDRDGCEPQFAVQTYFTVIHFVVCSALFGAGTSRRGNTTWEDSRRRGSGLADLLDVLPARLYPTVLKFSEFGDRPDPEYDFDFGLRSLLDGLEIASGAVKATGNGPPN
ncbi:MAG TPA: TetR/AcrR family transcriptional regulator [Acidimicrobiales bacterium]|nr:TetR/AcrR family transcriptional regulator [Acidimicrobiales bacterium]